MGFFGKKKETDRDKLLNRDIATVRYDSLVEALKGEFSLGSADTKLASITFSENREIAFILSNNKIIYGWDTAAPVALAGYLWWAELSEADKKHVIALAGDDPILSSDLLSALAQENSEALDALVRAAHDSTVETLLTAETIFSNYQFIQTELIGHPAYIKALSAAGFPLESIENTIGNTRARITELEKILGIPRGDYSALTVSLLKAPKETIFILERKFILGAAEAGVSLQELRENSSGFRWSHVLGSLNELINEGAVELKFDLEFEELPDDFIVSRPHEKIFTLTLELDDNLSSLLEQVFAISGDLELTRQLLRGNIGLETRIREIEDQAMRELIAEDYAEFNSLPDDLQVSLRCIIYERNEANRKRKEILTRIAELTVDDAHGEADDLFRERLQRKFFAIEWAADQIPDPEVAEELESTFHFEDEEDGGFSFNDGFILNTDSGDSTVRPITPQEELPSPKLHRPTTATKRDIDLVALAKHLENLRERTRKFD